MALSSVQKLRDSRLVIMYWVISVSFMLAYVAFHDCVLTHALKEHEEYSIRKDVEAFKILKNEAKLPWSTYVGSAGMPGKSICIVYCTNRRPSMIGQTAYMSWKEYSHAKKVCLYSSILPLIPLLKFT